MEEKEFYQVDNDKIITIDKDNVVVCTFDDGIVLSVYDCDKNMLCGFKFGEFSKQFLYAMKTLFRDLNYNE